MNEKIQIRYLHSGLIEIDKPKGWGKMTNAEKEDICMSELDRRSDIELIEAMADILPLSIETFFAETPSIEAIQIADKNNTHDELTIASSKTWDTYVNDTGGLLWKNCQKI